MNYKKKYNISFLDCENCSEELKHEISEIEGVTSIGINKKEKYIEVEYSSIECDKKIKRVIDQELLHHNEGHDEEGVKTSVYKFEDIDCANCAAKVENALNKNANIINASINFLGKTITVKHKEDIDVVAIINATFKALEPDAHLVMDGEEEHEHHEHHHHHEHEHECCCGHEHHHHDEDDDDEEEHEHHEHHHHEHEHECCCGHDHHHHDEEDDDDDEEEHEHHEHHHHHEHEHECCCGHEHHHHDDDDDDDDEEEHEHHHHHDHDEDEEIIESVFKFEDIDCPNCAAKVETALNKVDGVVEASVNFLGKKIVVKHHDEIDAKEVVKKVLKAVEPDAYIVEEENEETSDISVENKKNKNLIKRVLFIIGCILFGLGVIVLHLGEEEILNNLGITTPILEGTLYTVLLYSTFISAYCFLAYDIIYKSVNGIIHKDIFNESLLMVVASLGAIVLSIISPMKEFFEGCAVMLFYKIGEYLQDKATDSTKDAIQSLLEIKVDEVTLKDGSKKKIKDVEIDEIMVVKVGERIALDGVIISGDTNLDMRALTGESNPVSINVGEEVLSGSINLSKVIEVRVTKTNDDSTLTKVKKLVEEANGKKSKQEEFIAKFARIYTPVILIIAAIVGIVEGITGFGIDPSVTRVQGALNNVFSILVISCPCSLVISVPLAYFAGIGNASKNGVLVKGGNYLEALTKTKEIVFDKTGTITKGNFKVVDIKSNVVSKEELLKIAATVEKYSTHPIALSIVNEYNAQIEDIENSSLEEISGQGLKLSYGDTSIYVGNDKLMRENNIEFEANDEVGSVVYIARNNEYLGSIVVRDEIKQNSYELFKNLKSKNISTTMLTGDKKQYAEFVGNEVGIDEVHYELLPQEKYEILDEKLNKKQGTIVYVGDGINDTPSLSRADVGIALGGIGSDSAKEVADIVIMNDDIKKVDTILKISKFTKKIIYENVIFILLMKIVALVISSGGWLGSYAMLLSIFADVGVCLLCILNSLRVLYNKSK